MKIDVNKTGILLYHLSHSSLLRKAIPWNVSLSLTENLTFLPFEGDADAASLVLSEEQNKKKERER